MGENVGGLANRNDIPAVRRRDRKERRPRWRGGVITPPRGAREGALRSGKRACDDPPDRIFVAELARGLACAVVLGPESFDNLGARRMAITKNASDARPAAQGLDELIWKSRNCFREITPVEENRQASDLPVTRGRIFAVRLLGRGSVTANELLWQLQTRRPLALGEAGRLTDAERRQCRNR